MPPTTLFDCEVFPLERSLARKTTHCVNLEITLAVPKESAEAEIAPRVARNFQYPQGLMKLTRFVERMRKKGRITEAELHATSIAADESNTAKEQKVGIGGDDGHEQQDDERQRQIHDDGVGSAQERSASGRDDRLL